MRNHPQNAEEENEERKKICGYVSLFSQAQEYTVQMTTTTSLARKKAIQT